MAMLLDNILPEWHFSERHRRQVSAEPERIFAAVRELTLAETPVAAVLVRLRGMRPRLDRPIFDEMGAGLRGRSRGAQGSLRSLQSAGRGRCAAASSGAGRLRTFAEPGFAKTAFNFRLDGSTCPPRRVSCSPTSGAGERFAATGS